MALGFDWGEEIGPDGEPTGKMICFPSSATNCTVVIDPTADDDDSSRPRGFATLSTVTWSHDERLVKATQQINKILGEVFSTSNKHAALHILTTEKGPMFAWVSARVKKTRRLDLHYGDALSG